MRRDEQRLQDMKAALRWIADSMAGVSAKEFLSNELLRFAVAQQLTVVGEAASRLTAELKHRHPDVPWVDIAGLRNVLVHEYFGVHWPLVWKTATIDVPALETSVDEILRVTEGTA